MMTSLSSRKLALVGAAMAVLWLAACNAILGIKSGDATGGNGGGGASSSASSGTMSSPSSASSGGTLASSSSGTGASSASSASSTSSGTSPPCMGGGNPLDGHNLGFAKGVGPDMSTWGMGVTLSPSDGNVVVAGAFSDPGTVFQLNPLPYPSPDGASEGDDVYVAKFDTNGLAVWAEAFNAPMDQEVISTAADAQGNVFLSGWMQSGITFTSTLSIASDTSLAPDALDGWVAKLDTNGSPLWAKRFGTPIDDEVRSIAVDTSGNVVVAGVASGGMSMAGTSGDFGCGMVSIPSGEDIVFVTKLSPGGTALWCKVFPVDTGYYNLWNPAQGLAVAIAPGGNIVLAGGFEDASTTSFGQGNLHSFGGWDVFVAELDPNGGYLWAQSYGDMNDQWATQVTVDACGDILLTGQFNTSVTLGSKTASDTADTMGGTNHYHLWVAKLIPGATPSSPAVPEWMRPFTDIGDQSPSAITVDAAGDVALAGNIVDDMGAMGVNFGSGITLPPGVPYSPGSYHSDAFFAKLTPDGTTRWATRYSGPNGENGGAIACDDAGHTVIAGQFGDPINFGSTTLTPQDEDLFVARLGP